MLQLPMLQPPTLNHELLDDTVEEAALVAEALLASAQRTEVLSGLGHVVAVQANHDTSRGISANGLQH
jgi:hypothetical protein